MDKRGFSPERRELVFALSLLFLGAALRLLGLGFFPPGLNQDEASTGCDAWGLLVSGMDRNGDGWPVLFTSWGSGQNALYAYVLLPLMALFGRLFGEDQVIFALFGFEVKMYMISKIIATAVVMVWNYFTKRAILVAAERFASPRGGDSEA